MFAFHWCIGIVIMCGLIESSLWYLFYSEWNVVGKRPMMLFLCAILSTVLITIPFLKTKHFEMKYRLFKTPLFKTSSQIKYRCLKHHLPQIVLSFPAWKLRHSTRPLYQYLVWGATAKAYMNAEKYNLMWTRFSKRGVLNDGIFEKSL